jgi:acyl-CoA thioesterase I
MKNFLNLSNLPLYLAFVIVILSISLFWMTCHSLRFRQQLNALINNSCWEETLDRYNAYSDREIIFFGDSQVSLWQMGPFFGVLPIRNRGVSGDWASKALERFDRDVIASGNSSMVVILIGTNDLDNHQSVPTIVQHIETMLKKAKDHSVNVALCSLLPASAEHKNNRPLTVLRSVNSLLRDLCDKYNSIYVDFFSHLSDENGSFISNYSDDGLHPNQQGYFLMSKILFQSLKPYL